MTATPAKRRGRPPKAAPPAKKADKTAKADKAAKPFLKWAGGKAQLLEAILPLVPESFGTYHEPFVGGGAVFFRLRALGRVKKAVLSDANSELVDAYRALRDDPGAVVAELELLTGRTSEEDFYAIRAQDPDAMTVAQRTARLIYLNKVGFNGLYRVNSKGRFNVPYGRNAKPNILDRENLSAVSRALKGVQIEHGSFGGVLKRVRPGDFVYFDPPYEPTSKSASFTAYAKGGFGEAEQRQLAQVVEALSRAGVEVLLSNSDRPLARTLYERPGYEVTRVDARRAINSVGGGRGAVKELLVRVRARPESPREKDRGPSQLAIAFPERSGVPSSGRGRPK